MDARRPLSEREERRLLRLAEDQPASGEELAELMRTIRERMADAALADPKVGKRIRGKRIRVIGADLRQEKPRRRGREPLTRGEVGIYDYDRDVLVLAVIDLREGRVTRIEERAGIQPPVTAEEVEEAKKIALASPELRALRRRSALEVVAFPSRADPSSPSDGHRRIQLYFWSGRKRPRRVGEAVVDLSAGRVVQPPSGEGAPAEQGRRQEGA